MEVANAIEVDAIILCGGQGRRLVKVLPDLPKALAPIGNKSFLDILLDYAVQEGLRRFIFCLGHRASAIEERLSARQDCDIVFSKETVPLGTAGALKLCEPLRRSRTSLVMNGDSLCNFNIKEFLKAHVENNASASVAAVMAPDRDDGGFIEFAKDYQITRFNEKYGSAKYINAGVYALNSELWGKIPPERPCSIEKDVFPQLVGHGLFAWPTHAPLFDIGTPERLEAFRLLYASRDP